MPEIGETLRETRMRRRIDMTEVEAATKIRAKYLRALENEEWDLLPGPTFVKTFLRTYAEYLDLDPRLLVEEYRQRYERPSSQEMRPFKPGAAAQRRRRRRRGPSGPAIVVVLGVIVLLAVLYGLGKLGQNDSNNNAAVTTPTPTATASPKPTATPRPHKAKKTKPAAPKVVALRVTAVKPVYVCVVDASGKTRLNGTLQPGSSSRLLHSARFRMNFGNSSVRVRANGKTFKPAASSNPVGYQVRPGGTPTKLPESARVKLCA
jgi:cytoskeleton protein RodZ